MALNGFFSTSVLGMRSQALALEVIGTNVANVQSGGYRRGDTTFASVLSKNIGGSTDNNGVLPNYSQRISDQGQLLPSTRGLDVAISGQGFFVTQTELNGGDQVYTRDGSFSLVTANPFNLEDPFTGGPLPRHETFIVDKNGNFLMGYARQADGTFPQQGQLVPLRVDPQVFANTGQATTEAELILNLPSDAAIISDHLTAVSNLNSGGLVPDGMHVYTIDFIDSEGNTQTARLNFTKNQTNNWEISATYAGAPVAQVDQITLGGTPELNDVYTVQVDGFNISYVVQAGDSLADVVSGLVSTINNHPTVGARVVAAAGGGAGGLTLTSLSPGTSFTSTAGAQNASSTAQVDLLTISGAVEAGDVYTIDVDGTSVNYTVTGAEGNLTGIRNAIVSTINGTAPLNSLVTATAGGNTDEIVITADSAGSTITTTASVVSASAQPQVSTVSIGTPVTIEAGDVYSATINGTTVNYTTTGAEAGVADIRDGLRAAINADSTVSGIVTAANGGAANEITITHDTNGSSFTASVAAANFGATADNTITVATTTAAAPGPNPNTATVSTTTAAVTPVADNTATQSTTTANDEGLITTAVTQFPFAGTGLAGTPNPLVPGTLTQPSPISLSFSFPASGGDPASVANFELDLSGLTQFAAPFQTRFYSSNGFAASELESIVFDSEGHVVGQFANGTGVRLYKVPLAQFRNPDGLEAINGMVFRETEESGQALIRTADVDGRASFVPQSREISNVEITDEFTKMIQTQAAYNASANSFRTQDEMLELVRDMKR